jgi:hypothetical protein
MRLYLAGNLSDGRSRAPSAIEFNKKELDGAVERGMDPVKRLISYAYAHSTPRHEAIKSAFGAAVEYGLDSGAFSAWSRGMTVNLESYAEYILEHRSLYCDFVASLDVIPGSKSGGLKVTDAERERAAKQGWENWIELKRLLKPAGITPIHTYHRGEDIKWLKKLIDESEYLSLGGTSILPTRQKIQWLDSIMPYLTDHKGSPIRKLHGFACTAVEVMTRFPWASVDSASWLYATELGNCYIRLPKGGDTVVNFFFEDWKLPPSKHFSRYSDADRKVIAAYLASRGFTPEQLMEMPCNCCGTNLSYLNRDEINVGFFLDLEEELTRNPRPWRPSPGIFRLR